MAIGAASVVFQPVFPLVASYVDPDTGIVRYGGLFGHPNFAACVLGIYVLYLLSRTGFSLRRAAAIVALLFVILMTGSLGALGATLIGAGVILLRKPVALLLAVSASIALLLLSSSTVLSRAEFIFGAGAEQNSLTWRVQRWAQAFALAPEPNVFGVGWEQIEALIGGPAHSTFVALLVELGGVGFGLVLIAAAVTILGHRKTRLSFALVVTVAVASITDPIAFYPSTMTIWLAIAALEKKVPIASAGELGQVEAQDRERFHPRKQPNMR